MRPSRILPRGGVLRLQTRFSRPRFFFSSVSRRALILRRPFLVPIGYNNGVYYPYGYRDNNTREHYDNFHRGTAALRNNSRKRMGESAFCIQQRGCHTQTERAENLVLQYYRGRKNDPAFNCSIIVRSTVRDAQPPRLVRSCPRNKHVTYISITVVSSQPGERYFYFTRPNRPASEVERSAS